MDPSRTRSVVLAILIIAGILGLGGLALWYFSNQATTTPTGQTQAKSYCGQFVVGQAYNCSPENALSYAITESTSATCQPSSQIIDSGLTCTFTQKKSDDSCAQCKNGSDASIVTDGCICCAEEELKVCPTVNFSAQPIVKDITVTNSEKKLLVPPLPAESEIIINATYATPNDTSITYSQFILSVNGEEYTFAGDCSQSCTKSGQDFTVTKNLNLKDLGNISTLTVVATAKTSAPYTNDPTPASRVYPIRQATDAFCSSIITNTTDTAKQPVTFTALEIPMSNLGKKADVTKLVATFTIDGVPGYTKLNTKSLINYYDEKTGKIILNNDFLNTASNFVEAKAFPKPSFTSDSTSASMEVKIFASIEYTTNKSTLAKVLSCGGDSITLTRVVPDNTNNNGTTTQPIVSSNFAVLKKGPACIQRVSPSNQGTFNITITNADTDAEKFRKITDKLPRGFDYVPNSTKINGTAVLDSGLVTLTNVGESQQVVWQKADDWTLASNAKLTLTFSAKANSQAITGTNINEVVLEPTNAPKDANSIRSSYSFTVAQNCGAPKTGLFDSTASKIALGVIALLLGVALLTTQYGDRVSSKIAFTAPVRGLKAVKRSVDDKIETARLSVMDRRKYFEKKATERKSKRIKD